MRRAGTWRVGGSTVSCNQTSAGGEPREERQSRCNGPVRRARASRGRCGASGQLPLPGAALMPAALTGVVGGGGCMPCSGAAHAAREVGSPSAAVILTGAGSVSLGAYAVGAGASARPAPTAAPCPPPPRPPPPPPRPLLLSPCPFRAPLPLLPPPAPPFAPPSPPLPPSWPPLCWTAARGLGWGAPARACCWRRRRLARRRADGDRGEVPGFGPATGWGHRGRNRPCTCRACSRDMANARCARMEDSKNEVVV